jgi:hydroxylamine reductase (hybrid-cluster protein)
MSQAKCLHEPRVMVPNGGKRKDGTPILQCRQCVRASHNRSSRRKQGYDEKFAQQEGQCAFCDEPLADDNTTHREHNHATGKERGLVHARCNQMISGIEDAMDLIGLERVVRWMTEDR